MEEQVAQNVGLPIVPVPIIQVIRRINGEEVWVPAFQQ
jgi:hypothetical protein